MLEFSGIKLTVFSYVTEVNERVIQALQNCIPSSIDYKVQKLNTQSQFGDPLIIYSVELLKRDDIDKFLKFLGIALNGDNKMYFARYLQKKVDFDERVIYLRFNKFNAYNNKIAITEGSDIIRVELRYNAYVKKENTLNNLIESLNHYKILEEAN